MVVVDIGSGSVKLLVLGGRDGTVRRSHKTQLLAGGAGRISADALAATADAFADFASVVEAQIPGGPDPGRLAVVATAAARAASNMGELAALSVDAFGVEPTVLDGDREAALAFAGATADRDLDGPVVVVDIGAGSTELAIRTAEDPPAGPPTAVISMAVGGRSLTDEYLESDPPHPAELSSALSVMELHIDDVRRELPATQGVVDGGTVIVCGAMNQIARVEIGLEDVSVSVDGEIIQKADLEALFRALATETAADRACNPGLAPEHVGDIVGVMCVLIELCRQLDVEQVVVSERGLSHGVAAEMQTAASAGGG